MIIEMVVPIADPRTFIPMMKASVITLVRPCSFGLMLAMTREKRFYNLMLLKLTLRHKMKTKRGV